MSLTKENNCAAVPLLEQMRRIPKDWREMREVGPCAHQNVPYGRMLHEAADEIERQRATIEFVSKQLHSVKPDWNAIWRWLDDSLALDGNKPPADEPRAAQRCDYVGMYDAQCGLDLGHAGEHRLFGPHRGAVELPAEKHEQPTRERLLWLIGQFIGELPQKLDWLNPDVEREMRAALAPLTPYGVELLERARFCQCGICEACEFAKQRAQKSPALPPVPRCKSKDCRLFVESGEEYCSDHL